MKNYEMILFLLISKFSSMSQRILMNVEIFDFYQLLKTLNHKKLVQANWQPAVAVYSTHEQFVCTYALHKPNIFKKIPWSDVQIVMFKPEEF